MIFLAPDPPDPTFQLIFEPYPDRHPDPDPVKDFLNFQIEYFCKEIVIFY
jgi:hypothetical protein